MKVLLTGATGIIGTEVARQLATAGHSTRVLIRRSSRSPLTPTMAHTAYGSLDESL